MQDGPAGEAGPSCVETLAGQGVTPPSRRSRSWRTAWRGAGPRYQSNQSKRPLWGRSALGGQKAPGAAPRLLAAALYNCKRPGAVPQERHDIEPSAAPVSRRSSAHAHQLTVC